MDSRVQKCVAVVALVGSAVVLNGAAHAGPITTGLWKSEQKTLVNGKDAGVVLDQLNQQLRSGLPKGLGNNAVVTSNTAKTLGTATVCVTPQIAVTMMSPAMIFGVFAKMNPTCKLVPGTPGPLTLSFTGRCDDPSSFSGNVQGMLTVESASSWKTNVTGYGRFPDAMLTAMNLPAKSMVNVQTTSSNRWIASSCTAK